ncbi:MAG: hypothetical protein K8I30_24095 [Anaerolineae bacterium]|nr:hypothetical protein [Anaerolineae bacterium]
MRAYGYRMMAIVLLLTCVVAVSGVRAAGFSASVGGLAWSPDGQLLAYATRKGGVFVVPLGGEPRRLADPDVFDWSPGWSADGHYILSTISMNDQAGVFRTPVEGGEPEQLTEDVGWRPSFYAPNGMGARMSPDGKTIAFLSHREADTYTSLYSMTAAGDDEKPLTDVGTVYDFVWSPDGQAIAFVATPDDYSGPADLFLVDTFGTKLRRLTTTGDIDTRYRPAWMPDGEHLLFTAMTEDNKGRIDTIDRDGQKRKVFLEHGFEPLVSPDGERLVFSRWGEQWFDLWIISLSPLAESEAVQITLPGTRAYYSPAWSPDGGQIAFVSFLFDDPKGESIYRVGADGIDPQVWVESP